MIAWMLTGLIAAAACADETESPEPVRITFDGGGDIKVGHRYVVWNGVRTVIMPSVEKLTGVESFAPMNQVQRIKTVVVRLPDAADGRRQVRISFPLFEQVTTSGKAKDEWQSPLADHSYDVIRENDGQLTITDTAGFTPPQSELEVIETNLGTFMTGKPSFQTWLNGRTLAVGQTIDGLDDAVLRELSAPKIDEPKATRLKLTLTGVREAAGRRVAIFETDTAFKGSLSQFLLLRDATVQVVDRGKLTVDAATGFVISYEGRSVINATASGTNADGEAIIQRIRSESKQISSRLLEDPDAAKPTPTPAAKPDEPLEQNVARPKPTISADSTPQQVAVALFDVRNPANRELAVSLIADTEFGDTAPYLRAYKILIDDPDPPVRAAALLALARHGGDDGRVLVRERLRSREPFNRLSALRALAAYGQSDDVPDVRARLQDADEAVRAQADATLKAINARGE